jgi:hypothetical protein
MAGPNALVSEHIERILFDESHVFSSRVHFAMSFSRRHKKVDKLKHR